MALYKYVYDYDYDMNTNRINAHVIKIIYSVRVNDYIARISSKSVQYSCKAKAIYMARTDGQTDKPRWTRQTECLCYSL